MKWTVEGCITEASLGQFAHMDQILGNRSHAVRGKPDRRRWIVEDRKRASQIMTTLWNYGFVPSMWETKDEVRV